MLIHLFSNLIAVACGGWFLSIYGWKRQLFILKRTHDDGRGFLVTLAILWFCWNYYFSYFMCVCWGGGRRKGQWTTTKSARRPADDDDDNNDNWVLTVNRMNSEQRRNVWFRLTRYTARTADRRIENGNDARDGLLGVCCCCCWLCCACLLACCCCCRLGWSCACKL